MKALPIALATTGVIATLAAVGVLVVRSDWFRENVRRRIVTEAERATGGKVEIGDFRFNWSTLTAELDNMVIHGAELGMQPVQAPLLSVKRVVIGLTIVSLIDRSFRIGHVDVDTPQGHLIVNPDGTTNIRQPKTARKGNVVDLKIGKFVVQNGLLQLDVAGRRPDPVPWNGRGENLRALLSYDPAKQQYSGDLSVAPVHLQVAGIQPIDASVAAPVIVEKNRVTSPRVTVKTSDSEIELTNFLLDNFTAPVSTATYKGRITIDEIDRVFQLVNFRHTGKVDVYGAARFVSPRDYRFSGAARGSGLGYGDLHDLTASANFVAEPDQVHLNAIQLAALGGELRATGEVRNFRKFILAGEVSGISTLALTEFVEAKPLPWNGVFAGPIHATGNLSERDQHSLLAEAKLTITPAEGGTPVHGEIDASFDGAAQKVTLAQSWIELPGSRADFSGAPGRHLDIRARSRNINELRPIIGIPPILRSASGSFDGSLVGALEDPRITGHATLSNVVLHDAKLDEHIDSVAADFTASDTGLILDKASVAWNGLRADVKGSLGLRDWKADDASPVKADLQVSNGDLPKLLTIAGRTDLPVTGTLSAKGQIAGTVGDPLLSGDFSLTNGQIDGEPFDSITGQSRYNNNGVSQATATFSAGAKRINATASLQHSRLTFSLSSNAIPLNEIALIRNRIPDIRGNARMKLDGAMTFSRDGKQVSLEEIGGDISASALALGTRNFGEAHLTGVTKNGVFTGQFTSNAANASIRADGTVGLSGDYPVSARLSMAGLRIANVEAILNPGSANNGQIDGSIEGQGTLTGPARKPDQFAAAIELSKVELHAATPKAQQNLHNFGLVNDGPVRMQLISSSVRVEAAHFRGPETDLEVGGQIAFNQTTPLDLRIRGTLNTALAKAWEPDLSASGTIVMNASLRGTYDKPDLQGRAEIQNGEFRYDGFSNGLTNVKGVALFSGSRATIQSLTGETGGGTVEITGFSSITEGLIAFRLEAKAHSVRVRYPEGISSISDADLTFAGTEERSQASGRITVRRVAMNPRSDAASILAQASSPIRTAAAGTGFAAGVNLDIQVETAVDVVFETNMAQSVQADASLRLRGTVTSPALLGRINVTHGELVFFGNKYTISQGSLSFSDPAKIAPVLNIDLETKARGVDVTLTISGPVAKLNVSYRSDPPLQFADIVALLATGRTPTSATLATNTGQSPNFQQLNGQALLGQALANPAADRLQRFFGVSRIKIDPQLTGVTGSPEARLTIEQEVTPDLLLTYVSDVSNTSTQLIRVEWSFSRAWGVILTREENGYVALDFAYKKRFK